MDYKKILEGVVNIINTTEKSDIGFVNICTYIGKNCPELRKCEDEKMKEMLKMAVEQTAWLNSDKDKCYDWLEKQGKQKPNPYSGTSFEYNGHTWGMCARDGGVEILIDGHLKGRVSTNDSNAKEMFIKALERVEEQNAKGYKLTDCDKNTWWEDFKACTSCIIEQNPAWSEEDDRMMNDTLAVVDWYAGKHRNISVKVSNWLKLLKSRVLSSSLREFDKEEGNVIDHLIAICDDAMCYKTFAGCYDIEKCKRFLTNLKFGINPQPKQEWSEEDENLLIDAINVCELHGYNETAGWLKNRLKSLRPQMQWKAVDKEIYVKEPALAQRKDKSEPNHGYVICYDHTLTPDVYERFIMISDIYNQSHWKPSEEQMKVLDVAIKNSHLTTAEYDGLVKLREQLKKL